VTASEKICRCRGHHLVAEIDPNLPCGVTPP
jgi:hypothetical protein